VAGCHDTTTLDLAALAATLEHAFPSPQEGPCLDGLARLGDRLAAREGPRLLFWPAPGP